MTARTPRRSSAPTSAQTRLYAGAPAALASQLRSEIAVVPRRASGRPALVVLMGLPGAGKSHFARLLADRLGAAHVASDELRSRLFIAASYSEEENRAVFATAAALIDELLAEGHRVILDATNLLARNRERPVAVARARAVPVIYVRISAPDAEARARVRTRRASRAAGDHSEADEAVYERMAAQRFEPPSEGRIDVRNGPELNAEVERVARVVEAQT